MKTTSKMRRPQQWDDLKNEGDRKNEDDIKNENNLKNENEQICYLDFMPVTSKSSLKTKFICMLPHTTVSCLFRFSLKKIYFVLFAKKISNTFVLRHLRVLFLATTPLFLMFPTFGFLCTKLCNSIDLGFQILILLPIL